MKRYRNRCTPVITAEIVLEYSSSFIAKSVMMALEPDNRLSASRMRIEASVKGRTLHIRIVRCPTTETMQSTLEDIFRCIRVAQESISLANSKKSGQIRDDKRFK